MRTVDTIISKDNIILIKVLVLDYQKKNSAMFLWERTTATSVNVNSYMSKFSELTRFHLFWQVRLHSKGSNCLQHNLVNYIDLYQASNYG